MSDTDSDSEMTTTPAMGGAKRKNGHKSNCKCHICENMKNKAKRGGYKEDAEKAALKKMGGSKKKNGHKPSCDCPICKNMKNAKKGGYNDDDSEGEYDEMDKNDSSITGGKRGKKSNGHKANCKYPICKNMKKGGDNEDDDSSSSDSDSSSDSESSSDEEIEQSQKAGRRKKGNGHKAKCKRPICKNMKKKGRKGGQEPDEENQLGDIEEGMVKGDTSVSSASLESNEVPASSNDYNDLEAAEEGRAGPNIVGGTRKRRGSRKSGNGHKKTCKCPICKNMRNGKKTRRHKKRTHRRR